MIQYNTMNVRYTNKNEKHLYKLINKKQLKIQLGLIFLMCNHSNIRMHQMWDFLPRLFLPSSYVLGLHLQVVFLFVPLIENVTQCTAQGSEYHHATSYHWKNRVAVVEEKGVKEEGNYDIDITN